MTTLQFLVISVVPLAAGFYWGFKRTNRIFKDIPVMLLGLFFYGVLCVFVIGNDTNSTAVGTLIGYLIGSTFLLATNLWTFAWGILFGFIAHKVRQRRSAKA